MPMLQHKPPETSGGRTYLVLSQNAVHHVIANLGGQTLTAQGRTIEA